MEKVLALNENGDLTYCSAPADMRGKGRCNHVDHQNSGESTMEFMTRIETIQEETINKKEEEKPFIPMEGTTIKTKPYRMTEEEKEGLLKIENRNQLDQNMDGGYLELKENLWNDMDKNYFSELANMNKKQLTGVLHGEDYLITESTHKRFKVGRIVDAEDMEILKNDNPDMVFETGVVAMNNYAKENFDWEATKDVFVLPYYMRIGAGEDISSEITIGYKYLLRQHNNPERQQLAYEALLNNKALDKEKSRYSNGYKNKSLADEFVGKGGVFRAALSGSSIPYSARSVITPTTNMEFGEIKIPPTVAVDIFKPTLLDSLAKDGYSVEEMEDYISKFRVPQTEISQEDRADLERRIESRRVGMNRQPSLHTSSFQGFVPKISEDATTKIHPLYCEAYGADFDGDQVSLYGFNQDRIIDVVDRSIGAKNIKNTQLPRNIKESNIMPSKDALWGLLNILEKRTN